MRARFCFCDSTPARLSVIHCLTTEGAPMPVKILSGLVFIPHGGNQSGSVTITFDPFEISDSSNDEFELHKKTVIGSSGRFRSKPASIVAARQFGVLFGAPMWDIDFKGKINDRVTRDSIRISWNANAPRGRVDQEEIPFLVIGTVPDPPVARPGQPKGPPRPPGRKKPSRAKRPRRVPGRSRASRR